ncbi:MAG TPA: hypothetical protein VFZ34_10510, partial [Blastocatellia bacterium]|nr:hypothetical protein [Blastocatellia bacterium]
MNRNSVSILIALVLLAVSASTQTKSKTIALDKLTDAKPRNVKPEPVTFKGKKALHVTDAAPPTSGDGDRLLLLTGTDFQNGVIEVEMSGDVMPNAGEGARGFVGLAFRVQPEAAKFECFYLRPTNGRADDQVRRNHSVQYISHPEFPWQRLRKEFPEKYESYVDLVPGAWTKVKIEVSGVKAKLYVHGAAQPTLVV